MKPIKILDRHIFNRIAAGEVVESPHSVVKELVENSIDAGSTQISIAIEAGGIEYIGVFDNGKGIEANQVETAFLPHATSKIQSLDDLNAIATLGFRGEALPSIASVAEVTMVSKPHDALMGYQVQYINGNLTQKGEIGAASGTSVTVKHLFENIPARKKFLKKASTEAMRITELVKGLMLANPNLAFTYTLDDKLIYQTDGQGIDSAVYAVYGEMIEQMVSINHSMCGVTLKGYASKAELTKHNRLHQTLIVNNRVVENEEIAYSVFLAYKDFLMTRRFPVWVLYIDIPFDLVDVNVHPNKMQIKFVDLAMVKKMVYKAVRGIAATSTILEDLFASSPMQKIEEIKEPKAIEKAEELENSQAIQKTEESEEVEKPEEIEVVVEIANQPIYQATQPKPVNQTYNTVIPPSFINNDSAYYVKESAPVAAATRQSIIKDFMASQEAPFKAVEHLSTYHIVGKVFNTYIMVETGDNLFLIDQHAAHERLVYDRMVQAMDSKHTQVQQLLCPFDFTLSAQEAEYLTTLLPALQTMGFSIQCSTTETFSLHAVPLELAQLDLSTFIGYLLENQHHNAVKKSDFLKERIAQSACKASVKAHDNLSALEIESLLAQMQTDKHIPLCPHGRPTIIKIPKSKLESWFKRM